MAKLKGSESAALSEALLELYSPSPIGDFQARLFQILRRCFSFDFAAYHEIVGYDNERNFSDPEYIISLMGNEDLPFRGTVRSVGCGIFVTDGSSGQGTALLPSVSPTIDWVRLPQRFPVRMQVDSSALTELRIGQTASVAISHSARTENSRIPE